MASLSLKNICKVYPNGFEAVKDFSLEVEDKEFIIFVGPSGCGKSTTLRMIAGLEEISSGELYIDGKLVNDVEPKDRDIAMVFQNYALYPHMTVFDNMAFGLKLRKVPKDEIKKKIDELKEDVANGNLDPNNWGTDDNGNLIYDIYDDIDYWENQYESAPETRNLVEGRPAVGVQTYSNTGEVMEDNAFTGIAQLDDGSQYSYRTSSWGAYSLEVRIQKIAQKDGKEIPSDAVWSDYSSSSPYEKPTEKSIGISLDDAKKLAQEKADAMGLDDLNQCGWDYAIQTSIGTDDNSSYLGSGYVIYYSRTINGTPLTYTMDAGGALEDMDSTMETWAYENLYFYVNADGIDSMTYCNPYTIGETKTENLNLLPFSEIMNIYEKMMIVTNADNLTYENSRVFNIDRIVLGYARIYEPSTDSHTGLLVPVWDFFGSRKIDSEYDGETYSDTTDWPTWSFLTINAVDGSIIDRSLGY